MSNPTELLDLDRLEALARAADPYGAGHLVTHYRLSGDTKSEEAWRQAATPAAVLTLIALARRPPVPAQRPTDDELWDSTIRDRDTYHEWADKLAGAIAIHFGVDIGEHSNQHCPWHEALEAIESAEPARRAQPEGLSIALREVTDKLSTTAAENLSLNLSNIDLRDQLARLSAQPEGEAPCDCCANIRAAEAVHGDGPEDEAPQAAGVMCTACEGHGQVVDDDAPRGQSPCGTCKGDGSVDPDPAAQHAESGAPAGTGRQLMDQWTGAAKALEERATQAAAVKPWRQRVAESGKRECADLAVDCLMAEVAELRVLLKRPMLDEDAYLATQSQGARALTADDLWEIQGALRAHGKVALSRKVSDAASRAQQAAAPGSLPDQAQFEAQARYQGATNFTPVHPDFMTCNNGWTPATYRDPMTELAWRVWANKRAAPSAPGTPEAPILPQQSDMDAYANSGYHRFMTFDAFKAFRADCAARAAQLDGGQGEGEKA